LPPPPDLWADLGLGDPGYRLRPGRTGFDPLEMYAEYARTLGTLLRDAVTGKLLSYPMPSVAVVLGLLMWLTPDIASVLILAAILPRELDSFYFSFGLYFFLGFIALFVLGRVVRKLRPH
jgi:hypothetical protein